MIVKEVMRTNVICASSDTKATEVKNMMTENNVSKLPVVDNGKLVGIVTKNDLLKAEPSSATTLDMFEISYLLSKLTVKKIMNTKVISVGPNEVVEEAARIMVDNKISCLPVVDGDALIGIITKSDLFHMFTEMFGAREKGVRVVALVNDAPGVLAKVAKEISDLNANIISAVTTKQGIDNKIMLTIKATGLDEAKMKSIFEDAGFEIQDIRVN
ncbi:MAG: CBS domain-containing protein [Treponema sp.]|uniref:CBS and ACT domain-containing protein n=1 Tax=Treponema sp. TaxID=166 RepID=UPI001D4E6247|nr:CBS and ACT domain-containing protein [Treponema sp.]MBS7311152.1 CBS domain-containing protein [Treponema sp.]MCI5695628.1 CBS and ACT domain-containing protein [Spirochaetia bacterium]MDD5810702.1 CBS and ACT domain-containing protein [Treponema sp.]MDY5885788.1 CBS and ACT domain-containing protein [Treponema sp.]